MQHWMRTVAGGSMWGMTSLLAGVTLVAPAFGQEGIKTVEPYVVVVTTEKAPLKCSNGSVYYAVRDLRAGEMLRVNGEGPGWLRVEYTPGMQAYISAADADADKDGKSLKLNKRAALLAANGTGGKAWWPLTMEPEQLAAGTAFEIAQVDKGSDGVVQGYFVAAPSAARGFVKNDQVRKATAEEAAKLIPAAAKPPQTPSKPAGTPVAQPETPTAATGPGTQPASTVNNPAPAGTPEGFNPVTPAPTTTTPVEPTLTMANPVAPPPPPPPPPKDQEIEQIRTMFDKVMASKDESETATLIGMFDRKMGKLGSAPGDAELRKSLSQRLEALRLRQDIANQIRKVQSLSESDKQRMTQIKILVEQAEKQAIYTMVGRITTSTVYDGQRGLPLMYRVESADAISPRTVGYIVPREGLEILTKIGKVCGIVGETRFDDSLQLNIVAPRRIDDLSVQGTLSAPSGSPPGGSIVVPPNPPATPASTGAGEPAAGTEPEK